MKKFFAVLIALMIAATFSTTQAEEDDDKYIPTNAPPEMNHNDSIYFAHPDFYNMTSDGERVILTNYRTYQQTTLYTCGPACALTVLNYFGENTFDEMTIAKAMKTDPRRGTSLAKVVKFFRNIGWEVDSSISNKPMESYEDFRDFVLKNLRQGHPIMVENVEIGGHWRVIIGYDGMKSETTFDDVLIFADPYDIGDQKQDGYTIGSAVRFCEMWFDASGLLPKSQRIQPWVIAFPKSAPTD